MMQRCGENKNLLLLKFHKLCQPWMPNDATCLRRQGIKTLPNCHAPQCSACELIAVEIENRKRESAVYAVENTILLDCSNVNGRYPTSAQHQWSKQSI
jgi:hypothetical protein